MNASKFSRHFFNQLEVKPKPIVAHACTFSRALCRLSVITSRFDWFTGLSPSFLIGQSHFFCFSFTTLNIRNLLYEDWLNLLVWLSFFLLQASPHLTGIIDQIPSEELRRGLMLLSKVTMFVIFCCLYALATLACRGRRMLFQGPTFVRGRHFESTQPVEDWDEGSFSSPSPPPPPNHFILTSSRRV